MLETDLYPPIKAFLEGQGYSVKGEVKSCDVVAQRGDEELVIVELKINVNLKLLCQAVERKDLSDSVYIGVPDNCAFFKTNRKQFLRVLRMMSIGLLLVDMTHNTATAILDPGTYKPTIKKKKQTRLLKEFSQLVGDPNLGGSNSKKRMTVYRQKALKLSRFLQENGETKASIIKDTLSEPKARDILYANVYGWFDKMGAGVYCITPKGLEEYKQWVSEDS